MLINILPHSFWKEHNSCVPNQSLPQNFQDVFFFFPLVTTASSWPCHLHSSCPVTWVAAPPSEVWLPLPGRALFCLATLTVLSFASKFPYSMSTALGKTWISFIPWKTLILSNKGNVNRCLCLQHTSQLFAGRHTDSVQVSETITLVFALKINHSWEQLQALLFLLHIFLSPSRGFTGIRIA